MAKDAPEPQQEGPHRRLISPRLLYFFILGDVLGAGIYALVGEVAGEIGGAIWVAFLVALTARTLHRVRLRRAGDEVPARGGAALYVHRAFRKPFVTFMVAFAVMASGVTSASTLARAFGGDYLKEFIDVPTTLVALVFVAIVALINFRGISESVQLNVVLTGVELTGSRSDRADRCLGARQRRR